MRQVSLRWPDGNDLARMHTSFPGMFNELRGGGGTHAGYNPPPMLYAIRFAKRLIDISSPTESEFDDAGFLDEEPAALGYACRQEVSDHRLNLYASDGRRDSQLAHLHCSAVVRRARRRRLPHGRGACDTKIGKKELLDSVQTYADTVIALCRS